MLLSEVLFQPLHPALGEHHGRHHAITDGIIKRHHQDGKSAITERHPQGSKQRSGFKSTVQYQY